MPRHATPGFEHYISVLAYFNRYSFMLYPILTSYSYYKKNYIVKVGYSITIQ
jgi:hypothetical protein